MDAFKLMAKLMELGADESGIRDRFGDNDELYELCFTEFLTEPNIEMLEKAIEQKEYGDAFRAAHALKGVSGNLGLTAYYDAICVLVESLRGEKFQNADAEFPRAQEQLMALRALVPNKS